ncbi:MAG: hypothetical protein LUG50_12065 [Planctomycetaceae bacterium]|nr:hypothetical protein [Planctomycetaceae bacterium]
MSGDVNKPHVPKIDESKPVIWTPEDASRFLTSAIHEAQRPLAEALKQRPITTRALTVMVAIIVVAALVIALILSNQLEKAEKRAELNQTARDTLLAERHEISAKATTLEDRLNNAIAEQQALATTIDSLKGNEEILRKTQSDLARFRRQAELLRSQISGLEMEKAAIARQLAAIKALAMEDEEGLADDATPFDLASPDAPIVSTPVTAFDADSGLFIIPDSLPAQPADAPADAPADDDATVPAVPTAEATREMVDEAAQPIEPVLADDPTPPEPDNSAAAGTSEPATVTAAPDTAASPAEEPKEELTEEPASQPVEAQAEEPVATPAETPAAEPTVEPIVEPAAETASIPDSATDTAASEVSESATESMPVATADADSHSPITDGGSETDAVAPVQDSPAEPVALVDSDDDVATFEDRIPTTAPTLTPDADSSATESAEMSDSGGETAAVADSAPAGTTPDTAAAESVDGADSDESADTVGSAAGSESVETTDAFAAAAARYGEETALPEVTDEPAEAVTHDEAAAGEDAPSTPGPASDVSILDEEVIGVIFDRETDSSAAVVVEPDGSATGSPMAENVPVLP